MESPDFDVRYVARLARLDLTDAEADQFAGQLAQVLEYVHRLDSLDVSGVEPATGAVGAENVVRPDVARDGLTTDEALANAPARNAGLFMTVRVVE